MDNIYTNAIENGISGWLEEQGYNSSPRNISKVKHFLALNIFYILDRETDYIEKSGIVLEKE